MKVRLKRKDAHKVRNGAVPMGNLMREEAVARQHGEYHISQEPACVKERREFERALKREQAHRKANPGVIVIVRRKGEVIAKH